MTVQEAVRIFGQRAQAAEHVRRVRVHDCLIGADLLADPQRTHDLAAVGEADDVGEAGGREPDDDIAMAREILGQDTL